MFLNKNSDGQNFEDADILAKHGIMGTFIMGNAQVFSFYNPQANNSF